MTRIVTLAASTLMLIACSATGSHDGAVAGPSAASSISKTVPPRPANDLPARSVLDAMPDFNGIGALRFGMNAEQMRKAWGAPLYGEAPANDSQTCYYLRPTRDKYDLLFMVEADRFVRVDVKAGDKTAPGGGRVGMDALQIEKLYGGRTTVTPDKYDAAAKVIGVSPPHGENARLIFETDAAGKVRAWRIGEAPQIDYVEGCG